MPKVTIVPDDGKVIIDGEARIVDLSDMPADVHAVQWQGNEGEIEYRPGADGSRKPNAGMSDFAPFQKYIGRWNAAEPKGV